MFLFLPSSRDLMNMLAVVVIFSISHQVSADLYQDRAEAEFSLHCPYTDTCSHPRKESCPCTSNDKPCCEKCLCTNDCGTKCCPDNATSFLSQKQVNLIKLSHCIKPNYTTKGETISGPNYDIIDRCPPEYLNTTVIDRCQRLYNDFDFQEEPLEYFMPVSVNLEQIPYHNQYCAACHNVLNSDLVPWNLNLSCREPKELQINRFQDIPDALSKRPDCHIRFVPPFGFEPLECDDAVSRCNTTGLWQDYDPFLETACLSYKSTFQSGSRLFNNVHCFFCNTDNASDTVQSVCNNRVYEPPGSFIFPFTNLLRFNIPLAVHPTSTHTCDYALTSDQLSCKPLLCAGGFQISEENNTCMLDFAEEPNARVMFRAKYTLKVSSDIRDSPDFLTMQDDIQETIRKQVTNYKDLVLSLCLLTMDVVLNSSSAEVVNGIMTNEGATMWEYVDRVEMVLEIGAFIPSNTTSAVGRLESLFTLEAGTFSKNPYFEISHQALKTDYYFIENNNSDIVKLTERYRVYGYDNADGEAVIPYWWRTYDFICMKTEHFIEMWPSPFKPKVEILYENFDQVERFFEEQQKMFNSNDSNLCRITLNYDASGIFVCHEKYVVTFPETEVQTQNFNFKFSLVTGWLSFVCIGLSLISLTVTLVVYAILPMLRTLPGLNNVALVVSLMLYQVFYLISHSEWVGMFPWLCSLSAITVHFFLLNYACWMLIATVHAVRVFNTHYCISAQTNVGQKFLRYNVLAVLMSSVVVLTNIVFSSLNSNGNDIGYGFSPCYIRKVHMILFTVAIPLGIIILINIVLFLFAAVTFCRLPTINSNLNKNFQKAKVLAKLSTITGATWITGYLYQLTGIEMFAYMFVALNAGVGVFICISFVLTKRVWQMLKKGKKQISTLSTSGTTASTLSK